MEIGKMIGLVCMIFEGEGIKNVEGLYLYYCNGYYYLFMVVGGIEYDYCVILACFWDIIGFYEVYFGNLVLII